MLDQIPLKLDREGIKEREDDKKGCGGGGGGGGDFTGGAIILIFPSKGGDYWREAINRGTAIIQGNTVFLL